MKRRFFPLVLGILALGLTGCAREVVTVAGVQNPEQVQEQTDYIEIEEFQLKNPEVTYEGEKVLFCAVMIPEGYHMSEEIPGMYVHERYPVEASNVYYTVSEGDQEGVVSQDLTEELYEELVEAAYKEEGQEVDLTIQSFEQIDMEGIPGYKIRSSYDTAKKKIEQLTYLILAENTYTVTYSQLSDDEMMVDFDISEGEIRLVKEEPVAMASNK